VLNKRKRKELAYNENLSAMVSLIQMIVVDWWMALVGDWRRRERGACLCSDTTSLTADLNRMAATFLTVHFSCVVCVLGKMVLGGMARWHRGDQLYCSCFLVLICEIPT
jgi:hypothetical protein